MKKTFALVVIIFALYFNACLDSANPYKDLILPDKTEYSTILLEILSQDTFFVNEKFLKSGYISSEMIKLKINFHRPKPDVTDEFAIAQLPESRTSLLELLAYQVSDSVNRSSDSLFFAFQNDSITPMFVDTSILRIVRIATQEIRTKNKDEQYFGFLQFSIPILNHTKTKAYVQADFICSGLCGVGMSYVLEKTKDKWVLKLAKSRWVS